MTDTRRRSRISLARALYCAALIGIVMAAPRGTLFGAVEIFDSLESVQERLRRVQGLSWEWTAATTLQDAAASSAARAEERLARVRASALDIEAQISADEHRLYLFARAARRTHGSFTAMRRAAFVPIDEVRRRGRIMWGLSAVGGDLAQRARQLKERAKELRAQEKQWAAVAHFLTHEMGRSSMKFDEIDFRLNIEEKAYASLALGADTPATTRRYSRQVQQEIKNLRQRVLQRARRPESGGIDAYAKPDDVYEAQKLSLPTFYFVLDVDYIVRTGDPQSPGLLVKTAYEEPIAAVIEGHVQYNVASDDSDPSSGEYAVTIAAADGSQVVYRDLGARLVNEGDFVRPGDIIARASARHARFRLAYLRDDQPVLPAPEDFAGAFAFIAERF